MRQNRAGFTVLELLVAMGLLAALGAFVMQLVGSSFDMYRRGDKRGDLYANAQHILEVLEADLVAVHPGPDGRFLLEAEALKGAGGGFLLRIVRSIPHGESEHPVLRKAGTRTGGTARFDGSDPGPGVREDIAPPSGLMEVAWALLPDAIDEAHPGILTLYRGVSAPAFAAGGLFDPAQEGNRDEAWVRAQLKPVATDILGLWLLCMGQNSASWEEQLVIEGRGTAQTALLHWDSTRGIMPPSVFPLARAGSLTVPEDDIYPRAVRLVLQVARRDRPDAWLRSTMREDQQVAALSTTRDLPDEDEPDQCIKLGTEWMELGSRSSGDVAVRRAVRRSRAGSLGPGTAVYSGRTFRKTVAIPGRRSFWVEEGR
ncbi:MAG: type II secretion system protein [Planctomycetes bacterium]|nr:type II secretion system protein [Planctomycetota bacterium]